MNFYFREEIIEGNPNNVFRTAHIAKNGDDSRSGCLCNPRVKIEKWLFVEQLPERTHLCRRCEAIVKKNRGADPAGRDTQYSGVRAIQVEANQRRTGDATTTRPPSYSIDGDKKLAYVVFPEKGGLAETFETIRQLAADERLGKDFGILVDVRTASFAPTIEEAKTIVSMVLDPALFLPRPTAVVVSELAQYGVGSIISLLAGRKGAVIQVFHYNVEEAEAWLRERYAREK
jgi:hypothetical protein